MTARWGCDCSRVRYDDIPSIRPTPFEIEQRSMNVKRASTKGLIVRLTKPGIYNVTGNQDVQDDTRQTRDLPLVQENITVTWHLSDQYSL
jgi:hypothetical protein